LAELAVDGVLVERLDVDVDGIAEVGKSLGK